MGGERTTCCPTVLPTSPMYCLLPACTACPVLTSYRL
jgi:hypothetical protein